MTHRIVLATLASSVAMGQQHHEMNLRHALVNRAGADWSFVERPISSLRSRFPGARRIPLSLSAAAPPAAAATLGRLAYGRATLVHRFDLRLPPRRGLEVVTVHDLPPLRFDDEGELPRAAAVGARRAAGVICPSRFAAAEVRELLGVERVWVVPNGVDASLHHTAPATDAELTRLGVEPPYVLHAAGATKRKNIAALASAWESVRASRPDVTLVLCGPPDARRQAAFADVTGWTYLGLLLPRQLFAVMKRASAVVVPSTYEGFGLPALEAMSAGVPVVAVRRGALPEVCGDAALLVEPDSNAIAEGLLRVLGDEAFGSRLAEAGPTQAAPFTWTHASEATLAVYREVIGACES